MKTIIVQLKSTGLYFNDTECISWTKTNIDSSLMKNLRQDFIFWELALNKYDSETSTLYASIYNYNPEYIDEFLNQKASKTIQQLHFDCIHWLALEPLLTSYKKAILGANISMSKIPKVEKIIAITNTVKIKDLEFRNGSIRFTKSFKFPRGKFEIKIYNDHIIKEFNHIKPYFTKLWNRKTIDIDVNFRNMESGWEFIDAHSIQLNSIGENTFEIIKQKKVFDFLKTKPSIPQKDYSVYDFSDLLEEMDNDPLGNIDISEKEFLFNILEDPTIRNRKQLQYLVGKLHHVAYPLCFTLSSKFGFIFYIEGEEMNHFVWELLDSHATYLWNIKKWGYKKERGHIDKQIQDVLTYGRIEYRKRFEQHEDLFFHIINHNAINSPIDEHFPKWALKLKERLI